MDINQFNENSSGRLVVGKINREKITKLTGVTFIEEEVFIYPGAIKHINRNHPLVWNQYKDELPSILLNPDYIGQNPKVPNSVELYKFISNYLLLAIKLDPSGYVFVSSFYVLDNAEYKIKKRLASGRVQVYE
ncbi:plasmid-related protein [Planococcus halocryophilus]|uniref:PBECR3 domain-containing polyvalent protein n=1 Tax=Planococcus halocryophilus TaxID=1215089 RepID=UPI001F0DAC9C|nr:plasmid-related protein [Planococcus halocryophilus]MCH4827514.1 plasmid-related protein [Planococcus halocryophilus]